MANLFTDAKEGQPKAFVSGDFVTWKRTDLVSDYPTDLYSVQYVARAVGSVAEFTIVGTKEGTHFLFTATSNETQQLLAAKYTWQLEIIRDSDSSRVVVETGDIEVRPDLDNSGADPRSHAEILLAKIESLLSGKADSDVDKYEIGGRSLTKIPFKELLEAREFYRGEVIREKKAEEIRNGRTTGSTIQVRF